MRHPSQTVMKTTGPHSRRQFLINGGIAAAASGWAAPQAGKVPVIDCHTHAGTASALTAPWTTIADPAEILRRNREAGIDKACIFPISHETFEQPNREIAGIVKRFPG